MSTPISILMICCGLLTFMLVSCDKKQAFKADVKKAKVNGIEIAYYTRGSGEPLLMIMGFRGAMAAWDPALIEELSSHYKVIVFDNRGAGLSTDTVQDLTTIEQMAKDTAGLAESLGLKKFNLLGWSMGSRIALRLALDRPELLNTLILCSPNPGGRYQSKRQTQGYEKLAKPVISNEEILSLLYPGDAAGKLAAEGFVSRMNSAILSGEAPNDLEVTYPTVERQTRAMEQWDKNDMVFELLPTLKVPTLVATGLNDALGAPENARTIVQRIPFAWAAYFPNAGHGFLSQDHEQFSELVHVFIGTHSDVNGNLKTAYDFFK